MKQNKLLSASGAQSMNHFNLILNVKLMHGENDLLKNKIVLGLNIRTKRFTKQ